MKDEPPPPRHYFLSKAVCFPKDGTRCKWQRKVMSTNETAGTTSGPEGSVPPQPTEEEVETKRQRIQRMTKDSVPFQNLSNNLLNVIKKVTARKIFPWSKFLMSDADVDNGYVQLVFLDYGWGGKESKYLVARARSWKKVGENIMKQCSDRRARAIAAVKKACQGTLFMLSVERLLWCIFVNRNVSCI